MLKVDIVQGVSRVQHCMKLVKIGFCAVNNGLKVWVY